MSQIASCWVIFIVGFITVLMIRVENDDEAVWRGLCKFFQNMTPKETTAVWWATFAVVIQGLSIYCMIILLRHYFPSWYHA